MQKADGEEEIGSACFHQGQAKQHTGHGHGLTRYNAIMGNGSNGSSRWSKGEYAGAVNDDDDLADIAFEIAKAQARNNIQPKPYRDDDITGNVTLSISSPVDIIGEIGLSGSVITSNNRVTGVTTPLADVDSFLFTVSTDTQKLIEVSNSGRDSNLDVGVSLYHQDSNGWSTVLDHNNETGNPLNHTDFSSEVTLSEGNYLLTIKGVGRPATPGHQGYTAYGSLGEYRLQIREPVSGDFNGDGILNHHDTALLIAAADSGTYNAVFDLNGDGVVNRTVDGIENVIPGAPLTDLDYLVLRLARTWYTDINLDRKVDFADYLLVSGNLFQSLGDVDLDGSVDHSDVSLVVGQNGYQFWAGIGVRVP